MKTERVDPRLEAVDEVSKWAVGLGIVVVALFPLSIPILVLTAVALLPLALPVLALAVLVAPVLILRGIVRRIGRRGRPGPRRQARTRSDPLAGAAPVGTVNAERAG